MLEEFHRLNTKEKFTINQPSQLWILPHINSLKVNMDAEISTKNNKVGFGCIIRDAIGKVFGVMVDNMVASLILFNV